MPERELARVCGRSSATSEARIHPSTRAADRAPTIAAVAELAEIEEVITGHPAYEGHTLAQELYERRLAERRRRQIPDWFPAQDVVWEPWERQAAQAA